MDPKDGPEDQETRKEMEEDRKQVEEEKGAEAAAETGGRHGEDRSQSGSEGVPQPPVKLSEEEAAVNVEQELLAREAAAAAAGAMAASAAVPRAATAAAAAAAVAAAAAAAGDGGSGGAGMDGSAGSQPWPGFEKFGTVQTILDHNRLLIHEIKHNHETRDPDGLVRNVTLIRQLNENVAKVVEMYGDISETFVEAFGGTGNGK